MNATISALAIKLESLSEQQIAEVEDFADFLLMRGLNGDVTNSAMAVSAPSFEAIWDNPEDAAYDAL